jgi:hyperosmotically inducible protein
LEGHFFTVSDSDSAAAATILDFFGIYTALTKVHGWSRQAPREFFCGPREEIAMNSSLRLKIIAPILVLAMSVATPMFAEDNDSTPPGSASSSMHKAGESMESAASNTGHAVKDAYHGTVTALTDTKITAKVKHALHEAELTEGGDIDVNTVAGVVTLHGTARSEKVAAKAARVAENVEGVKAVKNNLVIAAK